MRVLSLATGLLLLAATAQASPADNDARGIDRAIDAAAGYLWQAHLGDHWEENVASSAAYSDFGGRTALCVYALLSSGQGYQSERMARTLDWLASAEAVSVYARAFRLLALCELPTQATGEKLTATIEADLQWLLEAARDDGAYDYLPRGAIWDNSNTHIAHLAVWSAARRGLPVDEEYWRRARAHWLRAQTGEGGWAYASARKPAYGSMTAAGVVSLMMCYDELHLKRPTPGDDDNPYHPIERGVRWLGEHFSSWENPRRGPQYYHYYLWALGRAGAATGYSTFGRHDWFAEGAAELLRTQSPNGGWGNVVDTCFALTFLGQGRRPILLSKLKYDGAWNRRTRDLANLSRWIERRFERPIRWQIVDIDAPLAHAQTAPILYISGASVPTFTDEHIAKLRRYAQAGGLILSEAAGSSAAFNVEMRKAYRRMFPDRPLEEIEPAHPVFWAHRKLDRPIRLSGVSNGVRLLALHSAADLSKAWQTRDTDRRTWAFQLAANLYFHATDFGVFGRRHLALGKARPTTRPVTRTIRVARLDHAGGADPEPWAYVRLGELMADLGVAVEFSEPMAIADLPADQHPIALMTGTGSFTLTDAERDALRAFINAGGLLVADAAGGSDAFDTSARSQLLTLLADAYPRVGRLSPQSEIYRRAGLEIDTVTYRRAAKSIYGDDRSPRLQAVSVDGRAGIIYSRDDLTAGLVGYHGHGLRGYRPASAAAIMRNLLLYAADRPKPEKPILQDSIDVEWKDR